MLQKSSVRKGFCAEDWRFWRVKWYIQHAGSVVFTNLPAWVYFFEKSFRMPKNVPKVLTKIISVQMLKMYKNAAIVIGLA